MDETNARWRALKHPHPALRATLPATRFARGGREKQHTPGMTAGLIPPQKHLIDRTGSDRLSPMPNVPTILVLDSALRGLTVPRQIMGRRGSVLGTKGTVNGDYTQGLIRDHARDCEVTLVGSGELAALAERALSGEMVDDGDIAAEIAPCFVGDFADASARTDTIVLAC